MPLPPKDEAARYEALNKRIAELVEEIQELKEDKKSFRGFSNQYQSELLKAKDEVERMRQLIKSTEEENMKLKYTIAELEVWPGILALLIVICSDCHLKSRQPDSESQNKRKAWGQRFNSAQAKKQKTDEQLNVQTPSVRPVHSYTAPFPPVELTSASATQDNAHIRSGAPPVQPISPIQNPHSTSSAAPGARGPAGGSTRSRSNRGRGGHAKAARARNGRGNVRYSNLVDGIGDKFDPLPRLNIPTGSKRTASSTWAIGPPRRQDGTRHYGMYYHVCH